jgi:hypothetical protein
MGDYVITELKHTRSLKEKNVALVINDMVENFKRSTKNSCFKVSKKNLK